MKYIKEIILEENNQAKTIDGFDEALIRYIINNKNKKIAMYDTNKCIKIIKEKENISMIEAYEQFQDTINQLDENENNPVFMNDFRETVKVCNCIDDSEITKRIDNININD
ncbi:MAG: hypothetical protein ACOCP8_03930 [archaeon]